MRDTVKRREESRNGADVSRREFVQVAGISAAGLALTGLLSPAEAKPPTQPPGKVKNFIKSIKDARLFDLSHTWDENSPIALAVNPPFSMELVHTHADPTPLNDGGRQTFAAEVMHFSGQHGAPTLDGIGHIGFRPVLSGDPILFGGVDAIAASSNPLGIGRSGVGAHLDIAHYPPDLLVNRGVLLDVARFIMGDFTPLPGASEAPFEITAQHLIDTAAAERVTLQTGDTVLIRTGWGQYFGTNNAVYGNFFSGAGPGLEAAEFLIDPAHRARAVGDDSQTFEKRPAVIPGPAGEPDEWFPAHTLLIPKNGVFIIENFNLEELAQEEVYEFLLVVPPLKIRGGTGSALRAFALAP